jgi:uncharacterized protein (TIGR03067 family)
MIFAKVNRFSVFQMALTCLLSFGAMSSVHADDLNDLISTLDGDWIAVAEESDGKEMKSSDVKKMDKTLKIDGKEFVLSWSGRSLKGTLETKPGDDPATIDMSGVLPTGKSVVLKGIYELKDDTLRICYTIQIVNLDEVERPTEFKTKQGMRHICVTYQRQKSTSMNSLDGNWIAVAEESAGKEMKTSDVKKMDKTLKIDGNEYVLSWSGRSLKGTLETMAGADTATIDMSGKLPNGKSVLLKGIYEQKDDTLRICYSIQIVNLSEVERPTEFETKNGVRHICVTYKLQK